MPITRNLVNKYEFILATTGSATAARISGGHVALLDHRNGNIVKILNDATEDKFIRGKYEDYDSFFKLHAKKNIPDLDDLYDSYIKKCDAEFNRQLSLAKLISDKPPQTLNLKYWIKKAAIKIMGLKKK